MARRTASSARTSGIRRGRLRAGPTRWRRRSAAPWCSMATPACWSASNACSRRRSACPSRRAPGPSATEELAMAATLVRILDGNTFVVSDERGDIEASKTDPTGLFSIRHALPVDLGPDDQRHPAQRPVHRRPPVLRGPLLPRPGDRHRVHRPQALGHPPAGGRRRLPRGADDPQPQRRGRPTSRSAWRPRATSPTCSRSRTRSPSSAPTTRASRARRSSSRYQRETFRRETTITASAKAARRRARPDVHGPDRRRTARGPRTSTSSTSLAGPGARTTQTKYGRTNRQAPSRTWRTASMSGSPRRRISSATGSRSRRPTGAASSTSRRSASRRPSPAAAASRLRACRGS